jgi:hypothetical protein
MYRDGEREIRNETLENRDERKVRAENQDFRRSHVRRKVDVSRRREGETEVRLKEMRSETTPPIACPPWWTEWTERREGGNRMRMRAESGE